MNKNPNFFSQFLRYFASDFSSRERFEFCITIILSCAQKRCQCFRKLFSNYARHKKMKKNMIKNCGGLGRWHLICSTVFPLRANLYRLWGLAREFLIFEKPADGFPHRLAFGFPISKSFGVDCRQIRTWIHKVISYLRTKSLILFLIKMLTGIWHRYSWYQSYPDGNLICPLISLMFNCCEVGQNRKPGQSIT